MPTTLPETLKIAAELAPWEAVPQQVRRLYKEARDVQRTVKKIISQLDCQPDYGYVWWHPERRELYAVLGDSDDASTYNKWHNALKAIKGVSRVEVTAEGRPRDAEEWIRIKRSAALGGLGQMQQLAGGLTGGPSPLSNALVGALLTGGLGYGAGALAEHLFPERFAERGTLRKTLGLTGAALGALPGLSQAPLNAARAAEAGQPQGLSALWKPNAQTPLSPRSLRQLKMQGDSAGNGAHRYDFAQGKIVTAEALDQLAASLEGSPSGSAKFAAAAAALTKLAWDFDPSRGSGGVGLRPVPMDAFNQAIWNDVRKGMSAARNPYGTKSVWGDNRQAMHTPPPLAAAAAGLAAGVRGMYNDQPILSPRHFVQGLAAAGLDLATAKIVGGTLGALGGLTPVAQEKLQDMGLWGGLIRGTVGSMMGMR